MTKRGLFTPEQIELARHALGLPNEKNVSYQNRYVANPETEAYQQWQNMVLLGAAGVYASITHVMTTFFLTEKGAEEALSAGESLNIKDFPASRKAIKRVWQQKK
jgi:hypothetical protein